MSTTTTDRAALQAELEALVFQHMEEEARKAALIEGLRAKDEEGSEGLIALRDRAARHEARARFTAGTPKARLARELGVGSSTIHRWIPTSKA